MDKENKYTHEEMSGLITMMLSGNVKAADLVEKQLARCHTIIKWLIVGWVITVFAFIGYLACYDTEVVNYGAVTSSKINAQNGNQAKYLTITNNQK